MATRAHEQKTFKVTWEEGFYTYYRWFARRKNASNFQAKLTYDMQCGEEISDIKLHEPK